MKTNFDIRLLVAALLTSIMTISCGGGGEEASTGTGTTSAETTSTSTSQTLSRVFLNAFTDFSCTGGWGNRNGALGRLAFSGSGSCSAVFSGAPGTYAVTLQAQIEWDGGAPYRISLDGNVIQSGSFPLSEGELRCSCPEPWRVNCPEPVIDIGAGTHQLATGSRIEFWGDDVYPCGNDTHGAYAKWRGITLDPVQ